jgi:hypothetical protein
MLNDSQQIDLRRTILGLHPEFLKYLDDIHVVYASTMAEHAIYCIPVVDILNEIREALNSGKKRIYFFNDAESLQPENLTKVQIIVELLSEFHDSIFFYSTSAPYGQEFYDSWLKQKPYYKKRITILSADNFEHSINQYLIHGLKPENVKEYEVKLKDKKFTCFNKIERLHRIRLIADMYKNNLVYNNFYSFEGGQIDWIEKLNRRINNNIGFNFEEMKNIIVDHTNDFPLRLNITEDRHNPIDVRVDDLQYINNSYFSIVTETYFYQDYKKYAGLCLATYYDTLFVSEKTYKSFALKHPFILLAFPNTLKYLKECGYKTFHPYIDESYDSIIDDELRYKAVLKEILRLCNQTDEEWLTWQQNVKPIIEHNFQHLLNKTRFSKIQDVDKLFE